MKNVFYALLTNIFILTSCSSNDDIINNDSSTSNATKYTIEFNVKTTDFTVETTPLRSLTDKGTFLQIVAYKESGEVYSDTVIVPEQMKDVITTDGNFPFKLELPKGKYHLAFIQKSPTLRGSSINEIKLKPSNFYTDLYGGDYPTEMPRSSNYKDYYQTIDISIPNTNIDQDTITNIKLDPMWSNISISIDDFTPPTGCHYVTIDVLPAYSVYNLSNKLATKDMENHLYDGIYKNGYNPGFQIIKPSINNGTISTAMSISKTSSDINNMKLVIKFYHEIYPILFLTKEIDLKTQVENGLNYNISGNCSNIIDFGGGQVNVTFTPFNENEVVYLPFE